MKITNSILPLLAHGAAAAAISQIENAGTSWHKECSVSSTLNANIYVVPDPEHAPKELQWAMGFLDKWWTDDAGGPLPYPGDFESFMHPDGFRVMTCNYDDLPWAVRKWREDLMIEGTAMERKFIAELDGVAFFAPGIVSWLGPLFAGSHVEPGKDACQDELVDIGNFRPKSIENRDVLFSFHYGLRVQVNNAISIDLHAEKRSKVNRDETFGDL
ncbi:hypothetical protein FDECE_9854 [Fusarium decemcellulare]|nr:hypothetical protein FDECE_9854 [Fusarium decemcellulare]